MKICQECGGVLIKIQDTFEISSRPLLAPFCSRYTCTDCRKEFVFMAPVPKPTRKELLEYASSLPVGQSIDIDNCVVSRCGPYIAQEYHVSFIAIHREEFDKWHKENPLTFGPPLEHYDFGQTPEEAIGAVLYRHIQK